MPLWLTRVLASIAAAFALAQLASFLVTSGAIQVVLAKANPHDPTRQLERSLVDARRLGKADIAVIGHTAFVDAVRSSCRMQGRVIGVPLDRPLWPDYKRAGRYLSAEINPSLLIFQARPHLMTNVYWLWERQNLSYLPRGLTRSLLPLQDVHLFITGLKEAARKRSDNGNPALMKTAAVPSLIGALFDEREINGFAKSLPAKTAISAMFVLDPDEIPDDTLPDTRAKILETFAKPTTSPRLQLTTSDLFSERFGCDRNALRAVALEMRNPAQSQDAPEVKPQQEDED